VFDANDPTDSVADISDFAHRELDTVEVHLIIIDQDWTNALNELNNQQVNPGDPPPDPPDYEGVFLRFRADPVRFNEDGSRRTPAPPPITAATLFFTTLGPSGEFVTTRTVQLNSFFGSTATDGFTPTDNFEFGSTPPPIALVILQFRFPAFQGRNPERVDPSTGVKFDVEYVFDFDVSNEENPDPEATLFGVPDFLVGVVKDPSLGFPNPPPFPDATVANRVVAAGTTVILDGRGTFDSFNVGFDPNSPFVFDKDRLEFTWEWLSGPVRVDPVQSSPRDPTATVTLDVVGTYVYRLLVDDGVNALPNAATVEITVVESLAENHPPLAFITGPSEAVAVGSIITLDGSNSFDEDGDTLTYLWKQTNALGSDLSPEELLSAFQPLSGLTEPTSTWQALQPGRFYFRLLVSDGEFVSTAEFVVDVFSAATGGATEEALPSSTSSPPPAPAAGGGSLLAPLCGFGLTPVALVPLGILTMRRRR